MFLNDNNWFIELIEKFAGNTGIAAFFEGNGWMNAVMIVIAIVLLYLAIFKKVEPYLLLPISFGMLLVNLPLGGVFVKPLSEVYNIESFVDYLGIDINMAQNIFAEANKWKFISEFANELRIDVNLAKDWFELMANANTMDAFKEAISATLPEGYELAEKYYLGGKEVYESYKASVAAGAVETLKLEYIVNYIYANQDLYNAVFTAPQWDILQVAKENNYSGLLGILYFGVKSGIYPCLIFLGIGATTDFGPLIANPKSMILGAAAQIGIFITFIGALLMGFTGQEAASIGIIGGADGPTAILTTSRLAEHLLPAISIAAYSYMALVPVIQPPIIRWLTTKKERQIKMSQLREVSKTEKIIFPILVTVVVVLLIPDCAPLIGMLMLGNLIKESGVVPNLVNAAANSILYIVTILLGICVGATANGETFLQSETLFIILLGVVAFGFATACGVLFGKIMCVATKGKVNPMIGAAGVSAVPMAARVVQKEGQKEDPSNFLLMHAMGPNVAGVIGSAIAAGILMSIFL